MTHAPRPWRAEARALARLALPIVVTQVAIYLLGVVDMAMVGRLSEGAVASVGAVALGNVWKMGTLLVAMGLVFGIDPFISQAHGAGDARGIGLAVQRGILLGAFLSIPVGATWWLAEPALLWLDQDPEIAHMAAVYVRAQVPSLPFFMVWVVLRQYLQGRGILAPTLWTALGANLLNVALNWILIYGNLGSPRLGALGSSIATCLVQIALPFAMLGWIRGRGLHRGAWTAWSREALRRSEIVRILRVGGPIATALAFELWAFQILTPWAGAMGKVQLAAHSIAANMASMSFMVPLGVGLATVTRVGNLAGVRRFHDAQRSAWIALALGVGAMAVCALVFVTLRDELPWLYLGLEEYAGRDRFAALDKADVARRCSAILPIVAAFQVFDGAQVVGGGVLRGLGRTRPAMVFHGIAFYAIGLPLAHWLAFELGWELAGLWWGIAAGLAVVSVLLLYWVWRFGPERDPRTVHDALEKPVVAPPGLDGP